MKSKTSNHIFIFITYLSLTLKISQAFVAPSNFAIINTNYISPTTNLRRNVFEFDTENIATSSSSDEDYAASTQSVFLGASVAYGGISIWMDDQMDMMDNTNLINSISDSLTNPMVESDILSHFAHVTLDFFSYLTPEESIIRGVAIIGRFASIYADYLPDHFIQPSEVICHSIMLVTSLVMFAKAVFPIAMAATEIRTRAAVRKRVSSILEGDTCNIDGIGCSGSSRRDIFAWEYLFKPIGLSLFQFQCMSAVGVIDWVNIDAYGVIIDKSDELSDEYLYWIYRGNAELMYNGNGIEYVEPRTGKTTDRNSDFLGLFADMNFLCELDKKRYSDRTPNKNYICETPISCRVGRQAIVRAGSKGARVMRLKKDKLLKLMQDDDELEEGIRRLIVNGMESLLEAFLSVQSI
mmetsp:Transcript_21445/g.27637  ORF Transcript_21445/g.27637 Transcript_21445/m.27637 type:complete len:409 (+) Transcript_21445:185-1411(+)